MIDVLAHGAMSYGLDDSLAAAEYFDWPFAAAKTDSSSVVAGHATVTAENF